MKANDAAPNVISCYGDSNTRFYLGDLQIDGPAEQAYPAVLQRLFDDSEDEQYQVLNCGYPDMQSDFGVQHFQENVLDAGAKYCVLGFGTNNIRQEDADEQAYLADMERLITLCQQNQVEPMMLLIPWFAEEYAGKEAQERIPRWNQALCELCLRHNITVFNTYSAFIGEPERYFNETQTPKRHYSPEATKVIAQMVYEAVTGEH